MGTTLLWIAASLRTPSAPGSIESRSKGGAAKRRRADFQVEKPIVNKLKEILK
jgi:hypothetical protein